MFDFVVLCIGIVFIVVIGLFVLQLLGYGLLGALMGAVWLGTRGEQKKKQFEEIALKIKKNSNDPDAYFQRGTFYLNQRNYEESIKDLSKTIKLIDGKETKMPGAFYNRGLAKYYSKDIEGALKDFKKAKVQSGEGDISKQAQKMIEKVSDEIKLKENQEKNAKTFWIVMAVFWIFIIFMYFQSQQSIYK